MNRYYKNIDKLFYIFLLFHLVVWTLVPSFTNQNLPLDTIEALAWSSNLDWGFNKHPPMSAFFPEIFYRIFGPQDWVYYLLSQLFVIFSFLVVFKFSIEIFNNKLLAILSVLLLEGIFFYNFTTPEFNVHVSQLPFWALTVYFSFKIFNQRQVSTKDSILLGCFAAFGFLSKYLFIYLIISVFILFFYLIFILKDRKFNFKYLISIEVFFVLLVPHLVWLFNNDFVTVTYGLARTGVEQSSFIDHFKFPIIFLIKQILLILPFLVLAFILIKKINFKINLKDKKLFFLLSINLLPIILMLLTSIITGSRIRTMWMTPFYLFFGTMIIYVLNNHIDMKKIKKFYYVFLFFFIFSPSLYLIISLIDETKRTDYPGKEIARLVQNKWDDNFINEIKIVIGDEWSAGNLSYHLYSRPIWINDLKNKTSNITEDQGVIYTGNPKILKKICPGVFGTIKPVGYCMIGKR